METSIQYGNNIHKEQSKCLNIFLSLLTTLINHFYDIYL